MIRRHPHRLVVMAEGSRLAGHPDHAHAYTHAQLAGLCQVSLFCQVQVLMSLCQFQVSTTPCSPNKETALVHQSAEEEPRSCYTVLVRRWVQIPGEAVH